MYYVALLNSRRIKIISLIAFIINKLSLDSFSRVTMNNFCTEFLFYFISSTHVIHTKKQKKSMKRSKIGEQD